MPRNQEVIPRGQGLLAGIGPIQVPAVQGFYLGFAYGKINIPAIPWPSGDVVANVWCITDTYRPYSIFLAQPLSRERRPGRVAQSVTCLATDACLTADPGVASLIPVRSHTFVEIDHEMISMVILLPSADSFKKGCCQLQAKVCARITG